MNTLAFPVLAALVVGIVVYGVTRAQMAKARRRLMAKLDAEWGQPKPRAQEVGRGYYHSAVREPARSLDSHTWYDLNLDDVFDWLNRTGSVFGSEVLYDRLRSTDHDAASQEAFERLVERFRANRDARHAVQTVTAAIPARPAPFAWQLAIESPDALPAWAYLFPVVTIAVVSLVVATAFHPGLLSVTVLALATSMGLRAAIGWRLTSLIDPFRSASQLLVAGDRLVAVEPETGPTTQRLRRALPALKRLRLTASWMARDETRTDLGAIILDYLNMILSLDGNALLLGVGEARRRQRELREVVEVVGVLDAAVAIASVRSDHVPWCRPQFGGASEALLIVDGRHPLVDGCVPNSLTLREPAGAIITGANMSGKSTFLRMIGVNAVLARALNMAFAERYEAPRLRVRSCIGASDDLVRGKSLYQREAEAVVGILAELNDLEPTLCLFDELFRGTNRDDRVGATAALVKHLLSGGGATSVLVLLATHDLEITALLADACTAYHFRDSIGERGFEADFVLRPGVGTTRNAIGLLRLLGAPATMVAEAFQLAAACRSMALRNESTPEDAVGSEP